jgi:S-adenosylmethionine:tRNA ribosyltransferase-isomerase
LRVALKLSSYLWLGSSSTKIIHTRFRSIALRVNALGVEHVAEAQKMNTSDFDFDLPGDLIAQHPVEPRDQARLMVINRQKCCWEHRIFTDLPEDLRPPDVLVRNNTRVVPARLLGRRVVTGGKWEGLFLRERFDRTWEILAKTRGCPILGEHILVGHGLDLVLESRGVGGSWIVRPQLDSLKDTATFALLERHGRTPLPHYIRQGRETLSDRLAYQTVYAQRPGSVAAPTAGLHFTDRVFTRLGDRGITWVDLTLHVGIGTFRPIETQRLEDHVMHAEWAELPSLSATTVVARQRKGGRIVAVGTTAMRTLETAAARGDLQPFSGDTQLFIKPGHVFRSVDALITNFHLPRSSLLVLVSAFMGLDLTRAVYAEAIRCRYRFFSYGDAMLIL